MSQSKRAARPEHGLVRGVERRAEQAAAHGDEHEQRQLLEPVLVLHGRDALRQQHAALPPGARAAPASGERVRKTYPTLP
jgi:hypothetical protein